MLAYLQNHLFLFQTVVPKLILSIHTIKTSLSDLKIKKRNRFESIIIFFLLSFFFCLSVHAQQPVISVAPDSISANLFTGQTTQETMTISNSGSGNLSFDISLDFPAGQNNQNYALQFDGVADCVSLPVAISNSIVSTGELTFEGWFKFSGVLTTDVLMITIGNNWDDWSLYLDMVLDNGRPSLTVSGNFWDRVVANTVITDGEWHFIAGTYDGAEAHIYVDGNLENSNF